MGYEAERQDYVNRGRNSSQRGQCLEKKIMRWVKNTLATAHIRVRSEGIWKLTIWEENNRKGKIETDSYKPI